MTVVIASKKYIRENGINDLLERAARISSPDADVRLWTFGAERMEDADYAGLTADEIIDVRIVGGKGLYAEQIKAVIEKYCRMFTPELLLFTNDAMGKQLCSQLAYSLCAASVLDCADAVQTARGVRVAKPVYAGNIIAEYEMNAPCMLTLRESIADKKAPRKANPPAIRRYEERIDQPKWLVSSESSPLPADKELRGARKVVVGGRAITGSRDMELLRRFADSIGAALAGTRPLVMNGLLPVSRLVGQSGESIAPELCVVVGASGATPFTAGIENAKRIVAINHDSEAGIFRKADWGVAEDYRKVLEKLAVEFL